MSNVFEPFDVGRVQTFFLQTRYKYLSEGIREAITEGISEAISQGR